MSLASLLGISSPTTMELEGMPVELIFNNISSTIIISATYFYQFQKENKAGIQCKFFFTVRWVYAYKTTSAALLAEPAKGVNVIYGGDDADANAVVRDIIIRTGFVPLPFGPLKVHPSLSCKRNFHLP